MLKIKTPSQKLCNIDLLRGVAAIAVLFWHYQHFYYPEAGMNPIAGQRAIQPLFGIFTWFYTHGSLAVQFFWILSGYVFFHVYEQRRNISLREFVANRFSRLYPLHFITLCSVAALQFVSWQCFGKFQIYPFNDLWHFILNVLMASEWGFKKGYSFNAPIWSISIELLVYGMFFAFLKAMGIRLLSSVLWLVWALLFYRTSPIPVFECQILFALGGVVNQVHMWLTGRASTNLSIIGAGFFTAMSLIVVKVDWVTLATGLKFGFFPSLIWLAAAFESKGLSSSKVGISMGNITYSSYLLHVPMQILIIMLLDGIIGTREIISTPIFLIIYILSVIGLAGLTYRFVELPLKLSCQALLSRSPSNKAIVAEAS